MKPKTIIVNELSNITLTASVKMSRSLRWRIRIAIWLISLAARITGAGFKVTEVEE